MKKIFSFLSVALAALMLIALVSCSGTDFEAKGNAKYDASITGKGNRVVMDKVKAEIDAYNAEDFIPSEQKSDYVLIKVKNYGDIVVVLRDDVAPITVKNFKKLVSEHFYDGMIFHRVIEGFMIQGGGFTSVGGQLQEKTSDNIRGEFTNNGVINNLTHVRGVISMARVGGMNNSASSQFFIVHETGDSARNLNGDYATFGYVLAGMDVVDAIATCAVAGDANAPKPIVDVVIESITFVEPK